MNNNFIDGRQYTTARLERSYKKWLAEEQELRKQLRKLEAAGLTGPYKSKRKRRQSSAPKKKKTSTRRR